MLLVEAVHAGWLPGGNLGVDLFFVLSGLLITSLLLGGVSLRGFCMRRAARLLPALLLLLATYLGYGFLTGRIGSDQHLLTAALIGGGYVTNFALASGHRGPTAQYLWHLWLLAEEEQFYLVWPVLLFAALRRRVSHRALAWVLVALVVCATAERWALLASAAPDGRVWFGPDTHDDAIPLGCVAALVPRVVPSWTALLGALTVAVIVAAPSLVPVRQDVLLTFASPVFPAACAVVILGVIGGGWVARAFAPRLLRYLGRISYGVYLWHLPLMHFAGVPAGLALTAVVAPVSYRYAEVPIRNLGLTIALKRETSPPPKGRPTGQAAVSTASG